MGGATPTSNIQKKMSYKPSRDRNKQFCENLRSIGSVDQENTGYGDTFKSFLYIKKILF